MAELVTQLSIRIPFWFWPYVRFLAVAIRLGLLRAETAFRHVEKVVEFVVSRSAVFTTVPSKETA